jgi:pentatricopeptide repeat protein
MTALCAAQQWRRALLLLSAMKRRGVSPDRCCYSCAVTAACKEGDDVLASTLLQEMRARALAPDVADYNTLLAQLVKKGAEQAAGAGTGAGAGSVLAGSEQSSSAAASC